MKHVQQFVVAALAVALVGCGGTGGGSGQQVATVLNLNPRVEAVVAVQRTNLMHPDSWTDQQLRDPTNMAVKADLFDPTVFGVQDPTNIETGEQMVFQLVNYSADGTRHILPGASFVSSDAASTYGVLAANTGQFTAGNTSSTAANYITASYNGNTYSTEYDIRIRQVRVLGTVLAEGTNAPSLAGSQVQFFNASNKLVDTVTIEFDGSIRASVPTNTTTFTVVGDSLPATFYHSFTYNTLRYDASVVSCFAPMPSGLVVGTSLLPGNVLVTPRVDGQSTPGSTGCSSGPVVKHS